MNQQVFIMAAGEGKRWRALKGDSSLPDTKHLVPVLGMPLIVRTVQQLKALHFTPTIVTNNSAIMSTCDCDYLSPIEHASSSLLRNILDTKPKWNGHVTILLGDVAFSNKAIYLATRPSYSYSYLGDRYEIFVLTIHPKAQEFISASIEEVLNWPPYVKGRKIKYCLRDLRWQTFLGGVPEVPFDELVSRRRDTNFIQIPDWTSDVDHYQGYLRLLRIINSIKEKGGEL